MLTILVLAATCLAGVLGSTTLQYRSHRKRLDDLDTVVHVNGIRGKSTVTRLIHGALSESGLRTVAKTTGTYACVIGSDRREHPIRRTYAPNILEQFSIFAKWLTRRVDAMVVECMAVRPEYQKFCQDKIVRADIVVITNVRIDHQEEMGDTVEEIAASLCSTMPLRGTVVTGEQNPAVLEIMQEKCDEAETTLIVADPSRVPAEHVASYRYLQFAENVAVGLEVCKLLGIDEDTALRGMLGAHPDPGMVTVDTVEIEGKRVHWVPAFAVNDKESTISVLDEIDNLLPEGCEKIGLLNNRADRGPRAELFADIVCEDVPHHFAKIGLIGDLERPIGERITSGGWNADDVLRLGATTNPSREELLRELVGSVPAEDVALVGMVNIHSEQAEMLIEYFEEADKVSALQSDTEPAGGNPHTTMSEAVVSDDPARLQAKADREKLRAYEADFAELGVDIRELARTNDIDWSRHSVSELDMALKVLVARETGTATVDDGEV